MSTAIAPQPAASPALQKFQSVATLLQSDSVQSAIARALPKHMTAERMIRVAMTALQKTPKLAECDQRSLVNALVQASELGLEPNTPLGEAYLIPYWNGTTKRTEAQLMPGYRGLIKLARQSEKIDGIYAELVFEKDFFSVELGLEKNLQHRPDLNSDDRGAMIGAYAVAKFKDGYTDFEYMNSAEIEKIRKRSKSGDNGPWKTDTGEMWRKTTIRRLTKRLPLSVEDNAFRKAVEFDSSFDMNIGNMAPLELGDGGADEGNAPDVITESQRMELVDAAKNSGSDITAIVHSFGFDLLADITVDKFDEILAALQISPSVTEPSAETAPASDAATDTVDAESTTSQSSATGLTYDEAKSLVDGQIKDMKAADVKKILAGRDADKMDAKQLVFLHEELLKGV